MILGIDAQPLGWVVTAVAGLALLAIVGYHVYASVTMPWGRARIRTRLTGAGLTPELADVWLRAWLDRRVGTDVDDAYRWIESQLADRD